jgi:hypothetical protein
MRDELISSQYRSGWADAFHRVVVAWLCRGALSLGLYQQGYNTGSSDRPPLAIARSLEDPRSNAGESWDQLDEASDEVAWRRNVHGERPDKRDEYQKALGRFPDALGW